MDTVVSKSVITKAAELAILDCKTDKDKIAVRKCAASMMAPGVDYLTVESILQEFSEALGPYGVFIKFILIIICVTAFFVENADDIKRNIERVVTPKKKEDSGIIIENPPKEDKKTIIEGPTAVPQKPSVTDIPSGDVKEKEIGRDIMPKSPAQEEKKIITYSEKDMGELPQNVQDSYDNYDKAGWKGNTAGQSKGTCAGRKWGNRDGKLPQVDANGDAIDYREFDVNDYKPPSRDGERFLVGSDGSVWYTDSHYGDGTSLNGYDDFVRIK